MSANAINPVASVTSPTSSANAYLMVQLRRQIQALQNQLLAEQVSDDNPTVKGVKMVSYQNQLALLQARLYVLDLHASY